MLGNKERKWMLHVKNKLDSRSKNTTSCICLAFSTIGGGRRPSGSHAHELPTHNPEVLSGLSTAGYGHTHTGLGMLKHYLNVLPTCGHLATPVRKRRQNRFSLLWQVVAQTLVRGTISAFTHISLCEWYKFIVREILPGLWIKQTALAIELACLFSWSITPPFAALRLPQNS